MKVLRHGKSVEKVDPPAVDVSPEATAAINIHQARSIAAESPKRTLRRVGKRKQLLEALDVAAKEAPGFSRGEHVTRYRAVDCGGPGT